MSKDEKAEVTPEQRKHRIGVLLVVVSLLIGAKAFLSYQNEKDSVSTKNGMTALVYAFAPNDTPPPDAKPDYALTEVTAGIGVLVLLSGVILIAGARQD